MANALTELSEALADAVGSTGAHVVRVDGRRRLPATGIIWSAEGIVVTANHVVKRDDGITVGLPDGNSVDATVAGRDPSTDLALLRVQANGLQAAPTENDMQVGNLVLALGRPGRTVQATLGIVSALGTEPWRTRAGGQIDRYLQTDVVMYPGFSGGPLVNTTGDVLGVNTSALVRGVSISIPTATVDDVVQSLLSHGRIRRGYLGVSTQPVRLPAGASQDLGQETGVLITGVEPESPADQGGLVLGDTIVSLDGNQVRQPDDLLALLTGARVGSKVPVSILRGGQTQSINVTIGER